VRGAPPVEVSDEALVDAALEEASDVVPEDLASDEAVVALVSVGLTVPVIVESRVAEVLAVGVTVADSEPDLEPESVADAEPVAESDSDADADAESVAVAVAVAPPNRKSSPFSAAELAQAMTLEGSALYQSG